MKRLIYFLLGIAFVVGVAFSPRLFITAGQVLVSSGGTGYVGYTSLQFNAPGSGSAASLMIGSGVAGNPVSAQDNVNAAYLIQAYNTNAGTGAASGLLGENDLGHSANLDITSSGYNTGGLLADAAYFYSNAAHYVIDATAAPITELSPYGVDPTKLTTTQMNALTGVTDGRTIYNTTTHTYWVYENGTWTNQAAASTTSSGSYTPTMGAVTNCSNVLVSQAYYTVSGSIVTVFIQANCVPTASGNFTISFTLPFTAAILSTLAGHGETMANSSQQYAIPGEVDTHSTTVGYYKSYCIPVGGSTASIDFSFSYSTQ